MLGIRIPTTPSSGYQGGLLSIRDARYQGVEGRGVVGIREMVGGYKKDSWCQGLVGTTG